MRLLVPALFSIACLSTACASPVVYSFSESAGIYSATGTITTDGTVGTLQAADISAFTLTLSNGTTSVMSDSSAFLSLYGTNLTATGNGLFFTYNNSGAYFALLPSAQSNGYFVRDQLCFTSGYFTCSGALNNYTLALQGAVAASSTQSGTQQIAVAVTPEPSGFVLLATGLLGAGAVLRRKLI